MGKNTEAEMTGQMPVASPPAYPRDELIQNAQAIFGVMPEVVLGALHGNDKAELTKDEVKAALESFRKRGVK